MIDVVDWILTVLDIVIPGRTPKARGMPEVAGSTLEEAHAKMMAAGWIIAGVRMEDGGLLASLPDDVIVVAQKPKSDERHAVDVIVRSARGRPE